MPAFLIYFCHEFRDRAGHVAYCEGVKETFKGIDAKYHAAYTKFEILEGPGNVQGVVVIEFPTYEIAKAWYDSPAYVALRGNRIRNSYTGLLVDGGVTPINERFPHIV
ncbi:MAG: hypothetical protein JWR80_7577 [Bradyrhizobium sp.]|nr:hypothetical protein [Bradyrhizobium sp.]